MLVIVLSSKRDGWMLVLVDMGIVSSLERDDIEVGWFGPVGFGWISSSQI
jgi:hypothetical protein